MDHNKQWGVVIVAAGRGTRMGTAESKQYLLLHQKPILIHTLERFASLSAISEIVLVTGQADVARCEQLVAQYALTKVTAIVAGGAERHHSVRNGLQALNTEYVLVHDAVRPLIRHEAIERCMQAAMEVQAAVLAVPVKDTIKQVNEAGVIIATPDRNSLWSIQTPQAFRRELLLEAHELAARQEPPFIGTDDAVVVERFGGRPVTIALGDYTNIKITTPEDLPLAAFWLSQQAHEHE